MPSFPHIRLKRIFFVIGLIFSLPWAFLAKARLAFSHLVAFEDHVGRSPFWPRFIFTLQSFPNFDTFSLTNCHLEMLLIKFSRGLPFVQDPPDIVNLLFFKLFFDQLKLTTETLELDQQQRGKNSILEIILKSRYPFVKNSLLGSQGSTNSLAELRRQHWHVRVELTCLAVICFLCGCMMNRKRSQAMAPMQNEDMMTGKFCPALTSWQR